MEGETSEIVLFLGRFHPLVLHVPIGFLALAFLLEIFSRSKRFSHYKVAVGFTLLLGAVTAAIAAAFGYMLSRSGGYDAGLLSLHQWFGIGVTLAAATAFALHWKLSRKPSRPLDRIYLVTISGMVICLAVAGHFGGSLTHGTDYLTQYMPDALRSIAGLPAKKKKEIKKITNLNEAVVYTDIIDPILDTHCVSCHNESKRKGELMMRNPEDLMKGGKDGAIFIPGHAAKSHLIQRIQLPEKDEDHMPPEGKRQLSEDDIALLTWWINEGAPFDKKVASLKVPGEVKSILNTLVDPQANKTQAEILLASEVKPASREILAQLQQHGIRIAALSDSIHWLQANVTKNQSGDSIIQAIAGVSEQLTWLNLGGTSTTDQGLAAIGAFKNLTRLHLGKTRITDDGLKYLGKLPHLETLNLYGTQISDEGIQYLSTLKSLKKIYLWQTNVTPEGALALRKALPGLEVNLGL